jgi:hypothetical protein
MLLYDDENRHGQTSTALVRGEEFQDVREFSGGGHSEMKLWRR